MDMLIKYQRKLWGGAFLTCSHFLTCPAARRMRIKPPLLLIQNAGDPGHEKSSRGKAEQRLCLATQGDTWRSTAKAWQLLDGLGVPGVLSFSIQNICDAEQVSGRPKMNIYFFCCSCIGMSKAGGNKLDGDTFCVKRCCEIMPQGMRPESWYPGVPGQTFTKPVKAAS